MSKKREIKKFYHGREIGILADYLGKWNSIPAGTDWLDYETHVPEDWNEATQGIGTYPGASSSLADDDEYALRNAVARICLSNVQEDLPQWAAVNIEGELKLGRKVKDQSQLPERILLPKHLFTINWAYSLSGPWPEAYHVTYLPGWDVHVVTASLDTDELYGYEDFALGWFKGKEDPADGSKDILINYWNKLYCENDQSHWEELREVDLGDPNGWAEEVWGAQEVESVEELSLPPSWLHTIWAEQREKQVREEKS